MAHPQARRRTAVALTVALAATLTTVLVAVDAAPASADLEQPYLWETEWGTTGTGDGQFQGPTGVAAAPNGSIYVSDPGNARVQVFDADGTFIDQWGSPGSDPGEFASAAGVAVDGDGNVWVADVTNDRIQKFDADGGFLDQINASGLGAGQLNRPATVAVDADGNVYVTAEKLNPNRVQKFDSDGDFVTAWGATGTGNGQFSNPSGVAVGPSGDVYVTDTGNDRVQVFDASGSFLRQFTTKNSPSGITVDADEDVFVMNVQTSVEITRYSSTGTELSNWSNSFINPSQIAADAAGDIFVADTSNDRIQRFGAGSLPTEPPLVLAHSWPGAVYEDTAVAANGNVYAAVSGCCGPQARIAILDPTGGLISSFGSSGSGPSQFNRPEGVAIGPDGTVYVADAGNDRIQHFTAAGGFLGQWGGVGSGNGQLDEPQGLVIAPDGTVYVADQDNRRVQVFDDDGTYLDQFTVPFHPNLPFAPAGIDIGGDGRLYVTDPVNHRVRVFETDGDLVDQWGGFGDERGELQNPWGIAVDGDGAVWVANLNGPVIQKFTAAGAPLANVNGNSWVTVDGDDVIGTASGALNRFEPAAPALTVTKTADQESIVEGDDIDLHVTVANTGNVNLTDVTVTDAEAPDCDTTVGQLSVGAETTIDCTDTVAVGEFTFVDGLATYANTASADSNETAPVDSNEVEVEVAEEVFALTVTKTDPAESAAVGSSLNFTVEITNTGNRPVTGLSLSDPNATCDTLGVTELAVAGSTAVSCNHQTTDDDIGTYTNTATADSDQTGPTDSNEVEVLITDPAIAVSAASTMTSAVVGEAIEYDVTVENTGDVVLSDLFLSTPGTGCAAFADGALDVGTTETVTCTHTATAGDIPEFSVLPTATTNELGAIDASAPVTVAVAHRVRPDGLIRLGNGPLAGNGRYNATGALQARATTVPNLGRATFTVQAQNDGTGTEDLRVRGAGSTSRFTVTYKRGTANVTNAVVNGTFRFDDVPAGATRNLTVIIQARPGTPRNAALTRLVTVSSAAQPTVKDVVKATVTRR